MLGTAEMAPSFQMLVAFLSNYGTPYIVSFRSYLVMIVLSVGLFMVSKFSSCGGILVDHPQLYQLLKINRFDTSASCRNMLKSHALLEAFQFIWAPSSEFVSSSIPSWQILTAHAQPFSGARDLAFCLKVPLDSLLVWASSKGSGETSRMRRLAWTFAARIGDKYQIRLTWSNYYKIWFILMLYFSIYLCIYSFLIGKGV